MNFNSKNKKRIEEHAEHFRELGLLTDKGFFLPGDKIIIPVFYCGEITSFVMWNYSPAPGAKEVKYLFPVGSKPIIGLENVRPGETLYLVEGIFDYFSMVQSGFPCICLEGTSLPRTIEKDLGVLESAH